jgi:protein arginine N-methyltransferase 1
MYSVTEFGRMIADEVRMRAYEAAIAKAVRPGAVVLDIGAGTGILSLLACRAGARQVYAVEIGDSIAVAEQIARANGLGDRVRFIQAKSTDITLPERADVVVSDLRGVLPLLQHHIPSIVDARARHLVPGGVLVPARDDLFVSLVEAPDVYEKVVAPWKADRFGFDMSAARQVVTNTWERAFFQQGELLADPARWASLDYRTIESASVRGTVTLHPKRPGMAHGLVAWFDAVLSDGIGYSNAPGQPETVYGSGFFPFAEPLVFAPGDRLAVTFRADLVGGDYVMTWHTTVYQGDGETPVHDLRQSTFHGGPLPMEKVRRRAGAWRPSLNQDGEIDAAILRAMTGKCPLEAIAAQVHERFPGRFRTLTDAMARVSDLSERYSQ